VCFESRTSAYQLKASTEEAEVAVGCSQGTPGVEVDRSVVAAVAVAVAVLIEKGRQRADCQRDQSRFWQESWQMDQTPPLKRREERR